MDVLNGFSSARPGDIATLTAGEIDGFATAPGNVSAVGQNGTPGQAGAAGQNGTPGQPGAPGRSINGSGGATLSGSRVSVIGGSAGQSGDGATIRVITGAGDDTIQISGSNIMVDAGAGTNNIFILAGGSDSFVLHATGTDVISGFSIASKDVLDMRSLLSEAKLSLGTDVSSLAAYVHVTNVNGTASVTFDPTATWNTAGSTIAVLKDVGSTVTSVSDLISGGGVRIT
ncbi:MAG: collagen-like protein [Acetobacteraceae bacterium]|nr:collagen-like protein [Acetobacteraceae bacterium]